MLNNKGFGLKEILMVICVMAIAVLVTMFLYDRNFKSLFEGEKVVDSEPTIQYKYENAEKQIKNAAKEYYEDNFEVDKLGDVDMKVTSKTLISKGYLINFKANDNVCSGYVNIKVGNKKVSYEPYVKCGDYITDGY